MVLENATSAAGGSRPRSLQEATWWLVVGHDPPAVFTVDGGRTLPVFGFREEAEVFLWFQMGRERWRLQEITADVLLSVLLGLHESTERVALDPPPRAIVDGVVDLMSLSREHFESLLLDRALDDNPAAARSPLAEKQT